MKWSILFKTFYGAGRQKETSRMLKETLVLFSLIGSDGTDYGSYPVKVISENDPAVCVYYSPPAEDKPATWAACDEAIGLMRFEFSFKQLGSTDWFNLEVRRYDRLGANSPNLTTVQAVEVHVGNSINIGEWPVDLDGSTERSLFEIKRDDKVTWRISRPADNRTD